MAENTRMKDMQAQLTRHDEEIRRITTLLENNEANSQERDDSLCDLFNQANSLNKNRFEQLQRSLETLIL